MRCIYQNSLCKNIKNVIFIEIRNKLIYISNFASSIVARPLHGCHVFRSFRQNNSYHNFKMWIYNYEIKIYIILWSFLYFSFAFCPKRYANEPRRIFPAPRSRDANIGARWRRLYRVCWMKSVHQKILSRSSRPSGRPFFRRPWAVWGRRCLELDWRSYSAF